MSSRFEPVTLGAPQFAGIDLRPFRVTAALFPPDASLAPHVHARPVVATVLAGSFDDRFRGITLEAEPESVLTEPAEERHANRFGRAGASVLIVEPDPAWDELLFPCRQLFEGIQCGRVPPAARVAGQIARELAARDELTPLAVEGLVFELLAAATRGRRVSTGRRPAPPWLGAAREVLDADFRRPPTVRALAGEVGVHPIRLGRAFKAHFRVSVGEYVRRRRLEWAATQLRATDEPLSAIALRAGFADQSHFSRWFKRRFGMTPLAYRRRMPA